MVEVLSCLLLHSERLKAQRCLRNGKAVGFLCALLQQSCPEAQRSSELAHRVSRLHSKCLLSSCPPPCTCNNLLGNRASPLHLTTARLATATQAYPDPMQFDPSNTKYYDAKATPDSPRWFNIDVRLLRRLQRPVTLAELKLHADGALGGMALFRQSRLSVQPVSKAQWDFIVALEGAPEGATGKR